MPQAVAHEYAEGFLLSLDCFSVERGVVLISFYDFLLSLDCFAAAASAMAMAAIAFFLLSLDCF